MRADKHFMESVALGDDQIGPLASISPPLGDRKSRRGEPEAVARLVQAAKEGDRDAFGAIYTLHHAKVFSLASFYLGAGAEDAVAETFVRAWQSIHRYKETGAPFVSWLYGIARHVVADDLKMRKRTIARGEMPERSAPQNDDAVGLRDAVAKLPRQQRQIIELKYFLGLKNPEVARALGKSVGAVNAQQWRALQTLNKWVER